MLGHVFFDHGHNEGDEGDEGDEGQAHFKDRKGVFARASVFSGTKTKTQGGLEKSDLMRSKTGKIVTKAQHAAGKKAYNRIKGWTVAVKKARKELGVKGFVAVRKGTALYKAAKAHYSK